jgi:hypothetical protein
MAAPGEVLAVARRKAQTEAVQEACAGRFPAWRVTRVNERLYQVRSQRPVQGLLQSLRQHALRPWHHSAPLAAPGRAGTPDSLRQAITSLKLVGGGTPGPTEAEVARFHVYADPDVGDPNTSWYALLRYTQADPATILDCGYTVEDGQPGAWRYEVNCDDQTFSVYYRDDERVTWPWSALPTDREFLAIERRLDPDYFW